MGEKAEVILSAVDEVSSPALKASDSLKAYQGTVNSLASLTGASSSGINPAYVKSIEGVSAAAEHSSASHRSAHQAMALVSSSLADLAGASPAAEAGVRVLDSAMFSLVTSGGAVSLSLLALVGIAAAAGVAFKTSAEHTKTEREEMDRLTASSIAAVKNLEYLDRVQKSVAGVGAAQAGDKIAKLKSRIDELTESMRKNSEQAVAMSKPQVENLGGMEGSVTLPSSYDGGKAAASQVKMASELRILQSELQKAQREQDALTAKSGKYVSLVAASGNPLRTFANEMERQASAAEQLGQIIGGTEVNYAKLAAGADKAGISVVQAAQIMVSQNKIAEQGVLNLASVFGQTLGNAVMKGKDAWREGLRSMIGMVFDTATQVLIAAAIMNKGLSAALIPFSFGAILAMVAVVQGLKMIAMNSLASGAAGLQAAAPTNLGAAPAASGGTSGSAEAGAGGRSISSASKEVVNNIEVHLPVQAMDLSSVSDIQMKTLATKIGRIIAEAAGQGQFSLVGA